MKYFVIARETAVANTELNLKFKKKAMTMQMRANGALANIEGYDKTTDERKPSAYDGESYATLKPYK